MSDLRKNNIFTVTIDGYSSDGSGVCHIDGRAVFVPRTIMGEICEIKIIKISTSAVYAKVQQIIVASPKRVESKCAYFGKCGGCDTWHMSYEEELSFKLKRVNDALVHIGKQSIAAEEIIGSDNVERYRNKGIFAVSERKGAPAVGFYRVRSHELIAVDDCLIQSELSCMAAKATAEFMRQNKLAAYNEQSGKGLVRHVFCRSAFKGNGAVACIVSAGGFGTKTSKLVDALRKACPELSGIVLNINKSRGNTVLAGDFYPLWGSEIITDTLCGFKFEISPQSFFQINPPQAEKLYNKAVEYAFSSPAALAFDLYCGAGTISLCLASHARQVIGAEIIQAAIENAKSNASRNGIDNIEFICGDAGDAAETLARRNLHPDVIVVDPPRKGMDEKAIRAAASMAPERLVYVSCNPATLARDILRFSKFDYKLQKATAVDMFPRTCHVETVCLLSKPS